MVFLFCILMGYLIVNIICNSYCNTIHRDDTIQPDDDDDDDDVNVANPGSLNPADAVMVENATANIGNHHHVVVFMGHQPRGASAGNANM